MQLCEDGFNHLFQMCFFQTQQYECRSEERDLRPFEGMQVHTLFYDEKPGMQALDFTADDRLPVPGTEKQHGQDNHGQ